MIHSLDDCSLEDREDWELVSLATVRDVCSRSLLAQLQRNKIT